VVVGEVLQKERSNNSDGNQSRLYEERVTILLGLRSALASPHASFRNSARRALGCMSDISDDENSPNYARINGPAKRIWEKLSELLHSSMHSRVVLQAVQVSAPMLTWWPTLLGEMPISHHHLRQNQVLMKLDLRPWIAI